MDQIVTIKETMSSLQIAELAGKEHKEVLRSIRAMEPAWEKVNGRKFALVDYTDAKGEKRPCYQLTKTECFYIATKYNDEARARIILRWEELEAKNVQSPPVPTTFREALLLAADLQQKIEEQQEQLAQLAPPARKKSYLETIHEDDPPKLTSEIARDYGMSANALNFRLFMFGVQHKDVVWGLNPEYADKGYTENAAYSSSWSSRVMKWTPKGRIFIYNLLKEHGILPTLEQQSHNNHPITTQ